MWREGDAEARANLAIEGMDLDADEHALFDMLRAEAVPPPLATAIVLKLLDNPDADPALAITPATIGCRCGPISIIFPPPSAANWNGSPASCSMTLRMPSKPSRSERPP